MNFCFKISQNVISVKIPSGYADLFPISNFKDFIVETEKPNAHLIVKITSFDEALKNQGKFEPIIDKNYQILNVADARDKYLHPQQDDQLYLAPNQLIIYNPACKTFEAFVLASNAVRDFFLPYIFVFVSHLLADDSGILMHGSGFEIAGMGGAFIGPSNAGKSTATTLLKPDFLLSDDVVAITNILGDPKIHSTPLGGKNDGVRKVPLKALFLPYKSKNFKIHQLENRQAILRFMAEHTDYIRKFFKPCIANIFSNAHQLFSKIPTFQIDFPKDFIDKSEIIRILEGV